MAYSKCLLSKSKITNSVKFKTYFTSTSRAVKWKPVVGLEIHAQIQSTSKLFSGAGTDFRSPTNRSVALFDAAFPGTLPVLNNRCVEAGVLTALALSSDLNEVSTFDRKHYFYSDMPAGYQITQQRCPLAQNGILKFVVNKDSKLYEKISHIHQIQLEQDSGRSLHDKNRSLVDLNRAGLPLMELVFKPDLSDGEEAASLVKELSLVLTRLGTCSCRMEEGALRVDANVSVHKDNSPLGIRTEIKNIGTVRAVANAVDYEIARQIRLLNSGKEITNETRSWDAESSKTVPMRDKEEKQDYRYMPEPNLPPLHLRVKSSQPMNPNIIDVLKLKEAVPESPYEMRNRFQKECGISLLQAVRLVNHDVLLSLFLSGLEGGRDGRGTILVNLLLNDVLYHLNSSCDTVTFKAEDLVEIAEMMQNGSISKTIARKILDVLSKSTSLSVREILEQNNWMLIRDPKVIEQFCESVIQENKDIVQKHNSGKKNLTKALESKAWMKSDGRADMNLVKEWFKTNLPFKGK